MRPGSSLLAKLLRSGRVRTAVAIGALVIATICAIGALQRIGQPYPGFFVWDNLFVPAVGEARWPGVQSGVEYHSWILEADGKALPDARALESSLRDQAPGSPILYTMERRGTQYQVRVPVTPFDLQAFFFSLGAYLLTAFVLLGLGISVLYLQPRDRASGAVFFLCTTIAMMFATAVDLFGPYRFRVLYFFAAGLIPGASFYLISSFPVQRRRIRGEGVAVAAVVGAGLLFGVLSNIAFFSNPWLLLQLDVILDVSWGLAIASAIAFFIYHFVRAPTFQQRQRTKIVLAGVVGTFFPALSLIGFCAGVFDFPMNFLAFPIVLFPAAIGYAIVRADLFDVDRIIQRATAWAVLSGTLLLSLSITLTVVNVVLKRLNLGTSLLLEVVLLLGVISSVGALRSRIQATINRIYDRSEYEPEAVLRTASEEFTTTLDLDRLVQRVLELLNETLQPRYTSLIGTSANSGELVLRGFHRPGTGAPGPPSSGLLNLPIRHSSELVRHLDGSTVQFADEALSHRLFRTTRSADSSETEDSPGSESPRIHVGPEDEGTNEYRNSEHVFVPLRLEGKLIGVLAVGPKRSGRFYTNRDVSFLTALASLVTVALENASAYRKIQILNVDLSRNNQLLKTTNEQLSAAQTALVHSERLAAVGEVAGAVAHAIRNPLATIKAAAQYGVHETDAEAISETFTDISDETDRLNERITGLLAFTRPFEPTLNDTTVAEVVQGAVDSARTRASEKKVDLAVDLGPECRIRVDRFQIEQAVMELIVNAVDASPPDSTVSVTCTPEADDQRVRIRVSDSGPGIPEEKLPRIFELFFTTKPGGTGFGLATVKKVIERHGGTASARNLEAGGACFTVTLPVT